jgi:hypothetical protein
MRTSANRFGDENLVGSHTPALRGGGHAAVLTATADVMRKFNRDTRLLTIQVVSALAAAMLLLGVVVRERNIRGTNLTEQDAQSSRDVLVSGGYNTAGKEESSIGDVTIEPTVSEGLLPSEILPWRESFSVERKNLESARTPVSALTPEMRHRSSMRIRFVDARTRLIALWRQSLAQSRRPRAWTGFWDSNKRRRKRSGFHQQNE